MNVRLIKVLFILVSLISILLACSLPGSATETPVPVVQDTVPPATEIAPPPPPTEVVIQHALIPADLPADRSSHAGDYDSSTTAAKKTSAGGDRFTFERFERPFNANTMDVYFSQLDIVDTLVFQDDSWIYGSITLKGPDASNALAGRYALELDLDLDGKGDWLIIAANPASTDWGVQGVQAFQDANKDVGSKLPMLTDEGVAGGDGFEVLVFDQGNGKDPDTAGARVSPSDPNTVEIAVKRSVLGDPAKYLINMWAGNSLLNPALFDINDHFTHEQAGAADVSLTFFYPAKEVSELDNSCRMAVGFQPTGQEPGLCEVFFPDVSGGDPAPGQPPPQGCPRPQSCVGNGDYWDSIKCVCNHIVP